MSAFMTVLAICFFSFAATAQTFDLSADFSLKKNPKGVWRYGYSSAQSLTPSDFRLDKSRDGARPIGFWHPDRNQGPGPGYYPYVAFNSHGGEQRRAIQHRAVYCAEERAL